MNKIKKVTLVAVVALSVLTLIGCKSTTVGKNSTSKTAKHISLEVKEMKSYNEIVTPTDVYFDTNVSAVKTNDRMRIEAFAKKYKENHSVETIFVIGHSDSLGTQSVNQKISQKRAENIALILESAGIDAKHIKVVPKGAKDPKDQVHAHNRRTEIVYVLKR